jgi:hypothetical protein
MTDRWSVHGSRVPTRDQPREACRGRRIVAAGAPNRGTGRRPSSAYHGSEGARLVARLDVSRRRRPNRGAVCYIWTLGSCHVKLAGSCKPLRIASLARFYLAAMVNYRMPASSAAGHKQDFDLTA